MRLHKNYTDIPDRVVRELLWAAAKGVDTREVYVEVFNTRWGQSHHIGPGFLRGRIRVPPPGWRYLGVWRRDKSFRCRAWVRIYVPIPDVWAWHRRWKRDGAQIETREEGLLWVAAHEFYHLHQKVRNDRRAKRKKRVYFQKPANEWAYKRLAEWRAEHGI